MMLVSVNEKKVLCGILCVVVLMFSAVAGAAGLVLGVHPFLDAHEVTRRFSPLSRYLAARLDVPVTVRVGASYEEHIRFVGEDRVDIAFMGPVSYIRMRESYGVKPIFARLAVKGKPEFHGKIFVRRESPVVQLRQLAGKNVAFVAPESTMGYLVPRSMLEQAGLPLKRLGSTAFLKNHENVALAVLSGDFDAGAVKEDVFDDFAPRGLRAVATTPALSEHLFVGSATLAPELADRIRQALLAVGDPPRGGTIIGLVLEQATALVPALDSDYDSLRRILGVRAQTGAGR